MTEKFFFRSFLVCRLMDHKTVEYKVINLTFQPRKCRWPHVGNKTNPTPLIFMSMQLPKCTGRSIYFCFPNIWRLYISWLDLSLIIWTLMNFNYLFTTCSVTAQGHQRDKLLSKYLKQSSLDYTVLLNLILKRTKKSVLSLS